MWTIEFFGVEEEKRKKKQTDLAAKPIQRLKVYVKIQPRTCLFSYGQRFCEFTHFLSLRASARVYASAFYVSLSLCFSLFFHFISFHCVNKKTHSSSSFGVRELCVQTNIGNLLIYSCVRILRQYAFQVYHRHWTFSFIFCFSSLLFASLYIFVCLLLTRYHRHQPKLTTYKPWRWIWSIEKCIK